MTRPLGKHQRDALAAVADPTVAAISTGAVWRTLAKRGFVRPLASDQDSFFVITPAGLRTLADELEAGRIKQELSQRDGVEHNGFPEPRP